MRHVPFFLHVIVMIVSVFMFGYTTGMQERDKQGVLTITIRLDSGANVHSTNEATVTPESLGFDSMQDWLDASDDKKMQAVQEYFHGNGFPEYSWD